MKEPLPPQKINSAYQTKSLADLVGFLHPVAFSPYTTTWLNAIKKGFFRSWTGLTTKVVSKYLPKLPATTMGHMDQTRKHVCSTKTDEPISHDDDQQEPNNHLTHNVFSTIEETGKVYDDQTGQLPVRSSAGNQYIIVLYDYESNAIITEALKTRQGPEILKAYAKIIQYLKGRGFHPRVHWLNNKASNAMKTYDQANQIEYQSVLPHMHRRNAAERAIRTWKNRFIAGLCSTDCQLPMHLWCRLIPQAILTLNMLQAS